MIGGVVSRIDDLNTVLSQTTEHRHRVLVAAAKNIKNWFVKVRKIKAIYHTLNMFNLDVTQKCLIAECWSAVDDLERIQMALRRGTERSGSSVPSILNRMDTHETPPTYNRTNKGMASTRGGYMGRPIVCSFTITKALNYSYLKSQNSHYKS